MANINQIPIAAVANEGYVLLHELKLGDPAQIKVMICRSWDTHTAYGKFLSTDYIISDEQGNVMQMTAKNNVAHHFIPRLNAGFVYLLNQFQVIRNRDEYRILRENNLMIELQGTTYLRRQDNVDLSPYIRHPFTCVDFEALEPTNGKYLIDVVGCVMNIGTPRDQKTGATTLDFELANERGQRIRVTLWGRLGPDFLEQKPTDESLYCVILTSVAVKRNPFGTLSLSSSSATLIIDDVELPTLSSFVEKLSGVVLPSDSLDFASSYHNPPPQEGNLAQLLDLVRRGKHNVTDVFKCTVELINVRMKNTWYYNSCSICKARKGLLRQFKHFWCESCNDSVPEPVTRFRIQFDVRDDSAETVVVFFDDTAEQLTKTTAACLLAESDQATCHTVVPTAIANLLTTTQVILIKANSYYEHGPFESFNCIKVITDEPVPETQEAARVDPPPVAARVDPPPVSSSSLIKGKQACSSSSTRKSHKRVIDVPTPAKELERVHRRKFIVASDSEDKVEPHESESLPETVK